MFKLIWESIMYVSPPKIFNTSFTKIYNYCQFWQIIGKFFWWTLYFGLPLSANEKSNSYDLILLNVNWMTKILYCKLVIVTIDTPKLAKVIINLVIQYYSLPNSIISDCRAIFTIKFWFSYFYFLDIKKILSIIFNPKINGQME